MTFGAGLLDQGGTLLLLLGGLVFLTWLGSLRSTLFLLVVVASFAVGWRFVLGGVLDPDQIVWVETGQRCLLISALVANVIEHGLRLSIRPFPLAAVIAIAGLSLVFGRPHPKLGSDEIIRAALSLALPWLFVNVVLERGSRRSYALLIAALPLLSVAIGALLHIYGIQSLYTGDSAWVYRLRAASNPDYFAALSFTGFIVAAHESMRVRGSRFPYLAFANLLLLIFSGGRMAIFAAVVWSVAYGVHSPVAREKLGRPGLLGVLGGSVVLAAFLYYLPVLERRMFRGGDLWLSGRDEVWNAYMDAFVRSQWTGRGLGAAEPGVIHQEFLPHNEYLRLAVEVGVLGGLIFLFALAVWVTDLWRHLSPDDRSFLFAAVPAIAVYALTDNIVTSVHLALFVYFGVMLTRRRHRRIRVAADEPDPEPMPPREHDAFRPASARSRDWGGVGGDHS